MKKPKYLLLGWRPDCHNYRLDNLPDSGLEIPGSVRPLLIGDAAAVIKAACAADTGVLLVDLAEVPRRMHIK